MLVTLCSKTPLFNTLNTRGNPHSVGTHKHQPSLSHRPVCQNGIFDISDGSWTPTKMNYEAPKWSNTWGIALHKVAHFVLHRWNSQRIVDSLRVVCSKCVKGASSEVLQQKDLQRNNVVNNYNTLSAVTKQPCQERTIIADLKKMCWRAKESHKVRNSFAIGSAKVHIFCQRCSTKYLTAILSNLTLEWILLNTAGKTHLLQLFHWSTCSPFWLLGICIAILFHKLYQNVRQTQIHH